ncbi:hypothetical protein N431DRAFT_438903 [Stipitochalara longipes BDJ]|nr:hypothetical protein N431DRAFT_438903 [Stipitochalara longipes BDJ]
MCPDLLQPILPGHKNHIRIPHCAHPMRNCDRRSTLYRLVQRFLDDFLCLRVER